MIEKDGDREGPSPPILGAGAPGGAGTGVSADVAREAGPVAGRGDRRRRCSWASRTSAFAVNPAKAQGRAGVGGRADGWSRRGTGPVVRVLARGADVAVRRRPGGVHLSPTSCPRCRAYVQLCSNLLHLLGRRRSTAPADDVPLDARHPRTGRVPRADRAPRRSPRPIRSGRDSSPACWPPCRRSRLPLDRPRGVPVRLPARERRR